MTNARTHARTHTGFDPPPCAVATVDGLVSLALHYTTVSEPWEMQTNKQTNSQTQTTAAPLHIVLFMMLHLSLS